MEARLGRSGTCPTTAILILVPVWCLLAQSAASYYKVGLEAYSKDDLSAAEGYLKKAREADPRLFPARFLLGATLVRMNRREEAIPELEAAHRLDPRHADVVKLLAVQYRESGLQVESLRLLQSFPEGLRDEEFYLLLIEANQDAGSVVEAEQLVRQAIRRYPKSPRVNAWMGFEMREAGRFTDAEPYLRKALQGDPELAAPYFLMGDVLLRQEKYREAIAWLRKALQMEPRDEEAAICLSRAMTGLGDLQGGLAELEREALLVPENAKLALEMSRVYARLGDSEQAHRQAQNAARWRLNESRIPESLRRGRQ
jgi:predicted Zn-dependent protease